MKHAAPHSPVRRVPVGRSYALLGAIGGLVRSDFDRWFKRIRNRIRGYRQLDLVVATSLRLREVEDAGIQAWRKWRPWELLLLMQWAIEFGETNNKRRVPDEKALRWFTTAFHDRDFTDLAFKTNGRYKTHKLVRSIGFQQFWFQEPLDARHLLRHVRLFPPGSPQSDHLRAVSGLDGREFVLAALAVWEWLANSGREKHVLIPEMAANDQSPPGDVHKLLDFFALPGRDSHARVESSPFYVRSRILQTTQTSPLVRYPFMRVPNGFLPFSRRLFEHAIAKVPFHEISASKTRTVIDAFADSFEQYVGLLLQTAKLDLVSESELRRAIGPGPKVVDFCGNADHVAAYWDAKATELPALPRALPDDKVAASNIKTTVLKGIRQGYSAVSELRKHPAHGLAIDETRVPYMTVVTYGDHLLGPSADFFPEFIGNELAEEIASKYEGTAPIPDRNVAVFSIDDLEVLVAAVLRGETTVGAFLERMADADEAGPNRCFLPRMHLRQPRAIVSPPATTKAAFKALDAANRQT